MRCHGSTARKHVLLNCSIDNAIPFIGRALVIRREGVSVNPGRHVCVAMTEPLRDKRQWHAAGEQMGSVGMPAMPHAA
jgi:hypothetical protein